MDFLPVFTSVEGEARTLQAYDAVQDRWPVPHREIDVATSFGSTHVVASGPEDAPPLVLLHAFFATAMSWYRAAGPLSAHHRVLAVDVLGEANRSRPVRPITSIDDSARWFAELVDGLDLRRFSLAGNSFGGYTAVEYARRMPDRVEALALIGPAATFTSMRPFYTHMFIPKAVLTFLPWLPGQAAVMRRSEQWLRAGLPRDRAWDALFHEVMLHGRSHVRFFPRVYTADDLAQVKAPTLLLLGDHERIYSLAKAAEQARALMPSIEVQTVPNAHHITALAAPRPVSDILTGFIEQARAQA